MGITECKNLKTSLPGESNYITEELNSRQMAFLLFCFSTGLCVSICMSQFKYSFPKINENNESLVCSRFESDKVDCLHLLPTENSVLNKEYIVTQKNNSIVIKSHWFGLDFKFAFGRKYSVTNNSVENVTLCLTIIFPGLFNLFLGSLIITGVSTDL